MAKQTTRQEMEDIIHACKQEIGRNQEEIDLLRRTLKASEVLVSSLEESLREASDFDTRARRWFDEERAETQRLRQKVEDLESRLNAEDNARGRVAYQRDEFRNQLNRALGWIDHARGIGPGEPAPDFAEVGLQHKGGGLG